MKASTAATLSYLEAVSGIVYATIILHEPITGNLVLGGTLIVGAAMYITRKEAKNQELL